MSSWSLLVRRTTGTFLPVSNEKMAHERKVVLPVVWFSPSLHAIFRHTSEVVEYMQPLDNHSLLVACASKRDAQAENPRASFLFNGRVLGDVFLLVKFWCGTYWQTLDFTLADLTRFLASLHRDRAPNPQYSFALPEPIHGGGVLDDDDADSGSEADEHMAALPPGALGGSTDATAQAAASGSSAPAPAAVPSEPLAPAPPPPAPPP